jgi:lysophospholipase L1-like esterase
MSDRRAGLSRRIVFFGDSIFVGQGVSPNQTFVTRLAADAEAVCGAGADAPAVYNCSVNGQTSRQALERIGYEVQSRGIDLMVLQFGLNDCNYWVTDRGLPRVCERGFVANMQEIIHRTLWFGGLRILLLTNHPAKKILENHPFFATTYIESSRRYNELIRDVARAASPEIRLVDIEAEWDRRIKEDRIRLDQMILSDGIHLSANGHLLYHEIVSPYFLDAVRSIYVTQCI